MVSATKMFLNLLRTFCFLDSKFGFRNNVSKGWNIYRNMMFFVTASVSCSSFKALSHGKQVCKFGTSVSNTENITTGFLQESSIASLLFLLWVVQWSWFTMSIDSSVPLLLRQWKYNSEVRIWLPLLLVLPLHLTDLLRKWLVNRIDLTHLIGLCSLNGSGSGSGSQIWTSLI
jgi:hypothetical protein